MGPSAIKNCIYGGPPPITNLFMGALHHKKMVEGPHKYIFNGRVPPYISLAFQIANFASVISLCYR